MKYLVVVERLLSSDESLSLGTYGVTVSGEGEKGNPRNLNSAAEVSDLLLAIGVEHVEAKFVPAEADRLRRFYPHSQSSQGAVTRYYDLDSATVAKHGF